MNGVITLFGHQLKCNQNDGLQLDHGFAPTIPISSVPDQYIYDPADPTPSVGGVSIENQLKITENLNLELI